VSSPTDSSKGEYNLRVTEDRLAVLLDCTIKEDGLESMALRVHLDLEPLELSPSPSLDGVSALLAAASGSGPCITSLVLAKGKASIPPVDGRIEWLGEFFTPGFVVDEGTGAVDYREHVAERSVATGQPLARLVPHVPGENGVDVFGKTISTRPAKPARIRSGANVVLDDESHVISATHEGRVRFENGMLTVDEVFVIPGSVGLATGNVNHPGAVEVIEDVEAGAEVRAAGDLTVNGSVESADIQCGGDLVVGGGITGSGKNMIRVGGAVRAKFVLDVEIECGREIAVAREVLHSRLRTQEAICMPSGTIIGGEAYARQFIDVKQTGSDAVVPTVLTAGLLPEAARALAKKEKQVEMLRRNLVKIHATVDPLKGILDTLPSDKQEALMMLMQSAEQMARAIEESEAEIEKASAGCRPQITVREMVCPETCFRIGESMLRIREPLRGPLRAVAHRGKVIVQPL
jgi:uncharacterized protein